MACSLIQRPQVIKERWIGKGVEGGGDAFLSLSHSGKACTNSYTRWLNIMWSRRFPDMKQDSVCSVCLKAAFSLCIFHKSLLNKKINIWFWFWKEISCRYVLNVYLVHKKAGYCRKDSCWATATDWTIQGWIHLPCVLMLLGCTCSVNDIKHKN